jgi:hypothetical protein
VGRFLSPDWSAKAEPVPYAKLDDPQSLNLYAYVHNNPLSGVDVDGHESDEHVDPNGHEYYRGSGSSENTRQEENGVLENERKTAAAMVKLENDAFKACVTNIEKPPTGADDAKSVVKGAVAAAAENLFNAAQGRKPSKTDIAQGASAGGCDNSTRGKCGLHRGAPYGCSFPQFQLAPRSRQNRHWICGSGGVPPPINPYR